MRAGAVLTADMRYQILNFAIELCLRFEKKEGQKGVDQRQYVEVMNDVVMPWIKKTYGDKDIVYCFQQDGAPCHTGAYTQEWLEENLEDFWPADMWPPNSPDLGSNSTEKY